MADDESADGSKVLVTVAALVAGLVAQQLVAVGWRAIRGNRPHKDDDSPLADALIFGAVSAGVASAARTWATRKARSRSGVVR